MRRLRFIALVFGILLAVAWLASGSSRPSPVHAQPDPPSAIAVDAYPSGNGPRSVARIDDCVSADAGQPVTIDIVLPGAGVPADRGLAGYQFSLYYDPQVVSVQEDDFNELLGQASGSNIITLSDHKPDTNGLYVSWAVDFGPSGIEPSGSSETGPGVLARLTLSTVGTGHTLLALRDVLLLDDRSQPMSVPSIGNADLYVGEPCPGQQSAPTSTPAPLPTPPQSGALTTEGPASTADPSSASHPPVGNQPTAAALQRTGGPPPGPDSPLGWLIGGTIAVLVGAGSVGAGLRFGGKASSFGDRNQ